MIKSFLNKNKVTFLGVGLGLLGGYLYYSFYGCNENCAIWASPVRSMLYGALLGGLLFNLIQSEIEKRKKKNQAE